MILNPNIAKYPLVFAVGLVVSYIVTLLVRKVAPALDMMDIPGARRVHKKATPLGGGIAVFLGFHAACAAIFLLPWKLSDGVLDGTWWWRFFVLSGVILIIGLVDDLKGMRAYVKLSGQVLVACLAYSMGIHVGRVLGVRLPPWLDLMATVFWIVAIVNAFNLSDGMDGLATGLAGIAGLGMAGAFLFAHCPGDALVLLGFLGACLAFLRFNFHPATIFLGDSGSMFLGLTVAIVALSTGAKDTAVATIVVPLLAVGVPVFDTGLAIWRRTTRRIIHKMEEGEDDSSKGEVFEADMDHIHHRLLKLGLSHRKTASYLYGLAFALVAMGLLSLTFESHALGIYLLGFTVATYVIVRHLAHVELWDSGVAIMRGLERPSSKVMAVLLYPVVDVILLSLALAIALAFVNLGGKTDLFRYVWFYRIPLWVGVPFLALFSIRAYNRVWSKARISEFVELGAVLVGGILLAGGFAAVMEELGFRKLALLVVIYTGVALSFVAGIRAFPRAVQDAMAWARRRRAEVGGALVNILVYGADYQCTLFLREKTFDPMVTEERRRIIGLLADDRNVYGRFVHGYEVLGGADRAAALIVKHDVREMVIAGKIKDVERQKLVDVAIKQGISLSEWTTGVKQLVGGGAGPEEKETNR